MSLIAQALDKAGRQPRLPSKTRPAHRTPPAPQKPPHSRPQLSLTLLAILLFIGLIGMGVLAIQLVRPIHQHPLEITAQTTAPSRPEPPVPPAQTRPASGLELLLAAQHHWKLTGTIHGGEGKSLALINGKMVEEGAFLEGARVVEIREDQITIEKDGETSRLTLE